MNWLNWFSILIAILVFGFLVFVHELGHFLTARAFGITVHEFSIGMGPKLVWYDSKKSGIRYKLCMIPFGGYVNFAGDGEDDASPSDDPKAIVNQKPWKRWIVLASGGVVNVVVGFLLMLTVVLFSSAIVSTTIESYPQDIQLENSSSTVLMAGDEILEVDGKRVHTRLDLDYQIMYHATEPVEVVVLRDADGDGIQEQVTVTAVFPTTVYEGRLIGLRDFNLGYEDKTALTVLREAFFNSVRIVKMVWDMLFELITGRSGMEAVSGPVGITGVVSSTVKIGFLPLLNLMAILSINLGVFNLLPIPALDGGRLLFVLWEMITRRPVPRKVEARIHAIGLILLLAFSLFVTAFDIKKMF